MTDHVKEQLCARIEELEKEKLELNEQLDIAQQERDALAAYAERLKPIAHYGLRAARNRNCPDSLEWTNILADAPETSLARLKAQWQAEALQELYNTWKGEGMMRVGALLDKAIELQEEAEGGEV